MTVDQEAHLESVKAKVIERLDAKYRHGQAEHGGNVWAKGGMLRQLTNEVDDLIVYRDVIEQQLRYALDDLRWGVNFHLWDRVERAAKALDALLNGDLD